jgi:MoxR-like ATPase
MPGPTNSSGSGKLPSLYGRRRECAVLDELLEQVRRGHSAVLVMRGEAGVGKTALLEYVARRARGCRLVRVTGCGRRWNWPSRGCISCARRC